MENPRENNEPFDSYPIWEQKCRSVPLQVTDQLEIVAQYYRFDVHAMTEEQDQVIQQCLQQGLQDCLMYIQPNGTLDSYIYQYVLSAMSIRHSYELKGMGKEAWT